MKNNYDSYKDLGLFNNGDYLLFSFKKTEKIVSAIYLVTSLLKDNEPLKLELREGGMSLISVSMALNSFDAVDKNRLIQSFFSTAVQLISFLNISRNSGIISNMNSDILIKEIYDIVDYLKQNTINSAYNSNFILSDSFFNADNSVDLNKGQAQKHDSYKTNKNKLLIVKDKKDTRQNSIINLLKKSSNLTIKDFVKVITDCSEKTIQRELIQLVEKGIVKREGERRWSTYSLV